MIVVTGATGNVGRPLVAALAAAGEKVTAVSRRITATDVGPEVRARQADLAEPESLSAALIGADALFLLTAGDFPLDGVVAQARDAGVGRVVLLSSQGVGTGRHPADQEKAVTESGLAWTVLRPGGFHSNTMQWAATVRAERAVAAPFGDVALPTVDPLDIAEVAAVTLREATHVGEVYTLTGPAPISPREQVAVIAAALGEPVRFTELTRAEARTRLTAFMPAPIADRTLDILGDPTPDEQRVSPDVERVLGRSARSYADWVVRTIAAFR
jgi:uncharacterized protein YbjT (DUF2867 family)